MGELFEGVCSGNRVTAYLESALVADKVVHAYLLVGDDASGKEAIALRFAAALVSGGDTAQFEQACRDAHPDLHILRPGGAGGYLVEQVRGLVRDAELAPIRASRKVYIIEQAERLQGSPANAFLKTLEEPPQDVVCVLLSGGEQAVLETLKSRCEVLVLDGGSQRRPGDSELAAMMQALASGCDMRTLLANAKRVVERASDGGEQQARAHERAVEQSGEFLSAAARRELEKQDKRLVSTRQRAALGQLLGYARSWLRDCLVVQQGASQLASAPDTAGQVAPVARAVCVRGIVRALRAVDTCSARISYNVTPQLAVEAMFIEIREALCQQ